MTEDATKGLWEETIDPVTGESSLQEHTPRVIWKSCTPENHYYEHDKNRDYTCKNCGIIFTMPPVGYELKDGKIIIVEDRELDKEMIDYLYEREKK